MKGFSWWSSSKECTQVRSLVQEDPTCHKTTKPVHHNQRVHDDNQRVCVSQLESLCSAVKELNIAKIINYLKINKQSKMDENAGVDITHQVWRPKTHHRHKETWVSRQSVEFKT